MPISSCCYCCSHRYYCERHNLRLIHTSQICCENSVGLGFSEYCPIRSYRCIAVATVLKVRKMWKIVCIEKGMPTKHNCSPQWFNQNLFNMFGLPCLFCTKPATTIILIKITRDVLGSISNWYLVSLLAARN